MKISTMKLRRISEYDARACSGQGDVFLLSPGLFSDCHGMSMSRMCTMKITYWLGKIGSATAKRTERIDAAAFRGHGVLDVVRGLAEVRLPHPALFESSMRVTHAQPVVRDSKCYPARGIMPAGDTVTFKANIPIGSAGHFIGREKVTSWRPMLPKPISIRPSG